MLAKLEAEHGSSGNQTTAGATEESKDEFGGYKKPEVHRMSYADLKGVFPDGVKPDRKE